MKYLAFILIVFLYACQGTTAQSPSKDMQEEQKFQDQEILIKLDGLTDIIL